MALRIVQRLRVNRILAHVLILSSIAVIWYPTLDLPKV